MPEDRLQRTREAFPTDYQFGDGKYTPEQQIAKRYEDAYFARQQQVTRSGVYEH